MKEKWVMRLFIAFIAILMLTGACTIFNRYVGVEDDNLIEELAEEVIRAQTGMELDLTPESVE